MDKENLQSEVSALIKKHDLRAVVAVSKKTAAVIFPQRTGKKERLECLVIVTSVMFDLFSAIAPKPGVAFNTIMALVGDQIMREMEKYGPEFEVDFPGAICKELCRAVGYDYVSLFAGISQCHDSEGVIGFALESDMPEHLLIEHIKSANNNLIGKLEKEFKMSSAYDMEKDRVH